MSVVFLQRPHIDASLRFCQLDLATKGVFLKLSCIWWVSILIFPPWVVMSPH